jgi:hypothetical protein
MTDLPANAAPPSPLETYKQILRTVVDNRPSGTRQRLAEAIGKNRSFISQIISPSYATPIPVQHLETIFHICHFAPQEREAFLEAYRAAHPGRLEVVDAAQPMRQLVVDLPDFGDADLNARADHLITSLARGIATLISSTAKTDGES